VSDKTDVLSRLFVAEVCGTLVIMDTRLEGIAKLCDVGLTTTEDGDRLRECAATIEALRLRAVELMCREV
jgi:hypothetical protein